MASADSKQDDIPLVYKANALRKNINSVQTFNKFNFRYTSVFFSFLSCWPASRLLSFVFLRVAAAVIWRVKRGRTCEKGTVSSSSLVQHFPNPHFFPSYFLPAVVPCLLLCCLSCILQCCTCFPAGTSHSERHNSWSCYGIALFFFLPAFVYCRSAMEVEW